MSQAVEYVLLLKTQQVCLFQIPPLTTSKGYYLDDWKQMFWEGGCKLTEKAGQLILYFIDKNTQAVQTQVQLPDNPYESIQKTVDSSRGYAVRLVTPQGTYQWVGCVFRDRNDAFDFNAKITDFIERREMERNPNKFKNEFQPTQDFSLKQGEKLMINFGGDQNKKQNSSGQTNNLSEFKFAPPPDFGDFSNYSQPQVQQQVQQQWGAFPDFNQDQQNKQPQQQQQQQWQEQTKPIQQQQWQFSQQQPQQQQSSQWQQPQQQQPQQQQQQQQQYTIHQNLLDL